MHYIMTRISRAVIARCWDSLATTYITLNSVKNGAQLWVFLLQLHILQRHTWTLLMHHQQAVSIVGDTCKELNVVLVLYILQRGSLLLFLFLFFYLIRALSMLLWVYKRDCYMTMHLHSLQAHSSSNSVEVLLPSCINIYSPVLIDGH